MFNGQNIATFRNSLKSDSGYQRVAWSRYAPDRKRGGVENPPNPAKSNRAPSLLYARAESRETETPYCENKMLFEISNGINTRFWNSRVQLCSCLAPSDKCLSDTPELPASVEDRDSRTSSGRPWWWTARCRWAGRDKLIKGNRQNTSVHNDTYKHLVPFSTSKTRDQLIVEFNETLKSLREAQQGNATISSSISTFNIHYDEEKIMRLLKMKIEKPELTEREHYLLELAQTGNTSQLNRMVTIFSNKNVCACPVCMQPVSEEYKQNLVQSVQKVLSKAVEEHQESLRQFIMDEIEFNFSP